MCAGAALSYGIWVLAAGRASPYSSRSGDDRVGAESLVANLLIGAYFSSLMREVETVSRYAHELRGSLLHLLAGIIRGSAVD